MPVYDYKCPACQTVWEAERKMVERDDPIRCPKCGKGGVRAFVSAPALPWYPGATRSEMKERLRKV